MFCEMKPAIKDLLEDSVYDSTPSFCNECTQTPIGTPPGAEIVSILSLYFPTFVYEALLTFMKSTPKSVFPRQNASGPSSKDPDSPDKMSSRATKGTIDILSTLPTSPGSAIVPWSKDSPEPADPNKVFPSYLDPELGIELVSQATIESMGKSKGNYPHQWFPGDELPVFEDLAWNDLERLFTMFSCKVEHPWTSYDWAPEPLRGFQLSLYRFYLYKTNQIRQQIEGIPSHRRELENLSEEEREARKLAAERQQQVEDRLTAGHKPSVALEVLNRE